MSAAASPVAARLEALRRRMAELGLDVYLVPSADEHQNEYLPAYKRRREAMSGFSGSAGEVAVCPESAHLWVDSRYHLQAGHEAGGAAFEIHKVGLAGVEDWAGWLTRREGERGPLRVGFDPFLLSLRMVERLQAALRRQESALTPVPGNLVDAIWAERPAAPRSALYPLPDALTGETLADKLARVRAEMKKAGAALLVLTRLDDIAWLSNLRGSDIPFNPVFESYALIGAEEAAFFTDNPLPDAARKALAGRADVKPYGALAGALQEAIGRMAGGKCWMDREGTSHGVRLLAGDGAVLLDAPNPVTRLKAVKNPVEIERARVGHLKSGAAKVRSLALMQGMLARGQTVSEADYAELLYQEYAREEGFSDLSFDTISAYGPNGAIVHYGTPDPAARLAPGGMLLVDSGIQVLGATTDDTRTVAIGTPDGAQRERFTSVLRAHIRLAMQVFPEGTTGQMLDALARSPLWNEGLDYGHGTGHGVGAFLNVHEGPQSISARGAVPLEPGMIVSNEPGYYRAGWGGIRLENLYVVEEALGLPAHPGGKRWLRLSPLTVSPFDPALTDPERMTGEERAWLAAYHRFVWESLAPRLEASPRDWLRLACGTDGG